MERFENYGIDEDKEIYAHLDDGTYSIEHIMPQHLSPPWVDELGDDYEEIHETWLHRLGNLTLTAYNSKYSNNAFVEKRDMPKGFRESGLRLNTWVAAKDKWTLAEMEERSDLLVSRALTIWSLPESSFKPAEKQYDSYSLEDDVDFSGREIVRFGYKNTEQPVDSWITMQERVVKMLHTEDRSVLSHLANEGSFKNVTTSKQYWICGFFGIGGFSIQCEAKMRRASVLLVMQKSNRDLNKDAFDYLFAKKAEIEAAMGTSLNWWRYEGKASYVDLTIDNVGMNDESSWTQMAKFHAEWSKKFYDVLVPLLKEWDATRGE